MNASESLPGSITRATRRRREIRYVAAALSAGVALLYFLIGLGVSYATDASSPDVAPLMVFGGLAGAAFLLGAVLLLTTDRRWLWIVGAALQVVAIVMYIQVAPNRTPPFEVWGILIKVLQVAILAALVYLIVDSPVAGAVHRRDEVRPV